MEEMKCLPETNCMWSLVVMLAIANNEKGTVEHNIEIPKLLYHAEYFAGKI